MRAFSFSNDDGYTQIGIEYQEKLYNFSLAWELYKQIKSNGQGPQLNFLQIMVETDFFHLDTLQEVFFALRKVRSIDDLQLSQNYKFLPPINRPQKILCIGRNYEAHAEELGNAKPHEPLFFCKAPSALVGHEESIRLPKHAGRVDHEGEVAVVIGKSGYNIKASQALEYVGGYSLLNDITARELQKKDQEAGRPWFRAKSFDTFCPFGPFLVPKESIHDHDDLKVEVTVNGKLRQEGSTSQMIFDIPSIIAYLSQYCTLEPGDIIATGTPSGVAPLQSGDVVELKVAELGTLRNSVA